MKILVAEDEKLPREMMVEKLRHIGGVTVEVAENGSEALRKAVEFQPDIVYTDIKMPVLSGLELINQYSAIKKDCLFIIVSGYDEFSYAQRAVQLGAFAYLLKPLNEAEFYHTTHRAIDTLEKIKSDHRRLLGSDMLEMKYQDVAIHKFLSEYFAYGITDVHYAGKLFQKYGLNTSGNYFCTAAVSIDDDGTVFQGSGYREISAVNYGIVNICQEIFRHYLLAAQDFEYKSMVCFLFNLTEGQCGDMQVLKDALEEIKDAIHSVFLFTVTIGVGKVCDNIGELPNSLQKACGVIPSRIAQGTNRVYFAQSETPKTTAHKFDSITERQLYMAVKQRDRDAVVAILETLYNAIISGSVDSSYISKANFTIIFTLFRIMEECGIPASEVLGSELHIHNRLNALTKYEDIIAAFREMLGKCFEAVAPLSYNDQAIHQAIEYINHNFDKNLPIDEVAGHVNRSVSYFSKLFKNHTGESFVSYLTKLRIEKAIDYIKNSNYTVDEISKLVGFSDVKYFHRTFKKTSASPRANSDDAGVADVAKTESLSAAHVAERLAWIRRPSGTF